LVKNFLKFVVFSKKKWYDNSIKFGLMLMKPPQNSKKIPDFYPCWVLDLHPGDLEFENLINENTSKLAKSLKGRKNHA
jgi:hypothetical protein